MAIVGLPNTGKSQLYTELTGEYTLVANYPLTTVETRRKSLTLKGTAYEFIDTPGLHSLYLHSEEQAAVRDLLLGEPLDALIQCIDANRLKASLRLTLDLVELGIPMVIALNAVDETEARGVTIHAARLAAHLQVPVVEHVASVNRGVEEIKAALVDLEPGGWRPYHGRELEARIDAIQDLLSPQVPFARKQALLLLDGDKSLMPSIREQLGRTGSGEPGRAASEELERALQHVRREHQGSVSRELARRRSQLVERMVQDATAREPRPPGRFAHAFARLSRRPLTGIPILGVFILLIYLLVVHVAGSIEGFLSGWLVEPVVGLVASRVPSQFWSEFLIGDYGVLTLGLFNAFVTVLPILSLFFLAMGVLEDIGYLPNLTVLTRRALGRIGLSGRSVMSLVLGFGCKTMATLTTKGISSRKERLIAIYLIAFAIPCSAQLAIDMAILGRVGLRAFLIAFGTLALVEVLAGFILNKIIKEDQKSDFIQELPPIRLPSARAILKKTYYRILWFLKEAVPIFLIASVVLFAVDRLGLLTLLQRGLKPVVVGWLGLPISMVEVLILSLARHEAAAGFLLNMVEAGTLSYVQSIVAVVITTMFVPCFANIVAMCRQLGTARGVAVTLIINVSSFLLAGALYWILVFLNVGP
ncbi:MAG: ferrous iron transport protein B [Spirochaetales bacterium]|nr:ferrous iron transport protein B [Spirochaetales bacterium]